MKPSELFKTAFSGWCDEGGPPQSEWAFENFTKGEGKDETIAKKILALLETVEKVPVRHLEEDIAELGPFDRGDAVLRAALKCRETKP